MNKEFEDFKNQAYENQETAINLLNENVELKKKIKPYEMLIEDCASALKEIEESENKIICYPDVAGALEVAFEKNFDKLVEMIEELYKKY